MTQLNLLPDVKIDYLRTTRNKRLVLGVSLVLIAASVAVLLLLVSITYGFQKKNLSDLNKDIENYNTTLKSTKDLDKVLTVQNQLRALTPLHDDKAVASRLFGYLTQLTPTNVNISQFDIDFAQNTMTITGGAASLDIVNTYVDTFKFTSFQKVGVEGGASNERAFSNVVLSSFSRSESGASYTVSLSFKPEIFDNANDVKLTVPKIISTRSLTEQPTDLFQNRPTEVKR